MSKDPKCVRCGLPCWTQISSRRIHRQCNNARIEEQRTSVSHRSASAVAAPAPPSHQAAPDVAARASSPSPAAAAAAAEVPVVPSAAPAPASLQLIQAATPARIRIPAALILCYSPDDKWDNFPVTIESTADLLLRGPYQLLLHNGALLYPLLWPSTKPRAHPRVGELNLILLHALLHLSRLVLAAGSSCRITLIPLPSVEAALQQSINQSHASESAASSPHQPQRRETRSVARAIDGFTPLIVENDGKRCSSASGLHIRFVQEWGELPQASERFYHPSLMWHGRVGSVTSLAAALTQLLSPLGAPRLFPPVSWDELIERKDLIYDIFQPYMLPSRWVSTADKEMKQLAAALIQSLPNGQYRVKGAQAWGASCGVTVAISSGACDELPGIIERFVHEWHQPAIGVQPFVDSFPGNELRFWTMADEGANVAAGEPRFRFTAILLKTRLSFRNTSITRFDAEVYSTVHDDSAACGKLLEQMLKEQSAFFERIYQLGVRFLRVDMGFNPSSDRAFLNEFAAAPDGNTWSQVHKQDLLWRVGMQMADGLGETV